jgi:Transcriptional regulatory protein, C terminal
MSHFQNMRSEFVLAGSRLQRVGAPDHSVTSSFDAVSLNVHVLRFGIFELDPHTLELRREGRLIHLRHQPARVLALLLERSGRLVSREEITNELWPSDVDVDVEQGLNTASRRSAPRSATALRRRATSRPFPAAATGRSWKCIECGSPRPRSRPRLRPQRSSPRKRSRPQTAETIPMQRCRCLGAASSSGLYQPALTPRFCSSSHFCSGAK